MAGINVIEQLAKRFSRELNHYEGRRIIIWHDPNGEFTDDLETICTNPERVAFANRDFRCIDAREYGSFELKRLVARETLNSDLLIYASWPLDLSGAALKDNFIADVELYSEHFQADGLSLLISDLGATGEAREGIANFPEFFRAKARQTRFKQLVDHPESVSDVSLGVMAVTLGAPEASPQSIIKTYLDELIEDAVPAEFEKYGADAALASLLEKRIGYVGAIDDEKSLATTIALSALSRTLPEGSLAPFSQFISHGREESCLSLWRDWQERFGEGALNGLVDIVEEATQISSRLKAMTVSELLESDVLPCTGELVVEQLMSSISSGADRSEEAFACVSRRRDLAWSERIKGFLKSLEHAAYMQSFQREHAGGYHIAKPVDVWNAYVSDWHEMDSHYRHLLSSADSARRVHADAPESLRDALDDLCDWADKLYSHKYLPLSNSCWVSAAENEWLKDGSVRGIHRQADFWQDVVERESSGVKRLAVIISDAMRFEVGAELQERLLAETKGSVQLEAMQSAFPSVTEFGMASLLPHNKLELDLSRGSYPFADGMSTVTTNNREQVLNAREDESKAIQAKELIKLKRDARKELLGNAKIIYLYHNLIDATGEKNPTEDRVLEACNQTIDDLTAVVKILINDLRFNRVVITSDHGFLYTRQPLAETEKITIAEAGADAVLAGRRHAITTQPPSEPFLEIKLQYECTPALYGAAPRECLRIKRPGPGELYVHGGVSLQELCVPVVTLRFADSTSKARIEQEPARLQLLSTSRRVTSAIFKVDLWQKEPVGGKVLAADYEFTLENVKGEPVSDVRRASASNRSQEEQARVTFVQLALKPNIRYSSMEPYYLVCRDSDGSVVWLEEFRVEVVVTPADDYGF